MVDEIMPKCPATDCQSVRIVLCLLPEVHNGTAPCGPSLCQTELWLSFMSCQGTGMLLAARQGGSQLSIFKCNACKSPFGMPMPIPGLLLGPCAFVHMSLPAGCHALQHRLALLSVLCTECSH